MNGVSLTVGLRVYKIQSWKDTETALTMSLYLMGVMTQTLQEDSLTTTMVMAVSRVSLTLINTVTTVDQLSGCLQERILHS